MDVGWRASGPSSCRAKAWILPPCKSALYFLGERNSQSCTLLEQGRSASASQCSTSSTCHVRLIPTRSNFYDLPRRRGKCNYASGGFPSFVGQISVAGSSEMKDNSQEVIEWHLRSGQQHRDGPDNSAAEVEGQNYALPGEGGQLQSSQYNNVSEPRCDGSPLDESTRRQDESEEMVKGNETETKRGWRGLASSKDVFHRGKSKADRFRKRWRKSNFEKGFKSAGYLTLSTPHEKKTPLLATNRDTNLDDLFKSLSSPRRSDRSSAVERYFGRDRNAKVMAIDNAEVAGDKLSGGESSVSENSERENASDRRASEPTNPSLSRKGERLKINLDLDLYRARCLREEGRRSEAEAILKQCIIDWQDDGRAYLALGLLALPSSSEQISGMDKDMDDELSRRTAAAVANMKLFARDNVIFGGDVVEDEEIGSSRATVPRIPRVSGGERLKINLDLELYQAKCLRQKGRLDDSESTLRKCIRDWPDDGRPYVALGKQLSQQNRIQEARTLYDSGCQAVRGENPYIWQTWAVLEEKCGDVSKARKLFDAATVADKKHVAGWHGWAKLELRAGNVRRARSLLNKGLKFCGSNDYIFQTLALLELREGKVEQARSLLSKATQYNPKSVASWLAWALMEAENGLTETARRLFQKGIEASPKNRYVWQAWACFEAKQGKEELARELFQRGHELNPKDVVLLQAFALFEFKCGRPGVARDLFRRALSCDSSHQPVWIAWGWMEWKQRNLSVARELYQGAIQADSRSMDAARAFQAWGVLEDREGDCGLARELFKCALKVDSQNVPTWMSWANMEDREGRSVRADEIRNLFLQQRTEVVEGPWDVDFSELLAPAIDRIKGFFRVDQRPAEVRTNSSNEADLFRGSGSESARDLESKGEDLLVDTDGQEFDVESFLKKNFPWKYGHLDRHISSTSKSM